MVFGVYRWSGGSVLVAVASGAAVCGDLVACPRNIVGTVQVGEILLVGGCGS